MRPEARNWVVEGLDGMGAIVCMSEGCGWCVMTLGELDEYRWKSIRVCVPAVKDNKMAARHEDSAPVLLVEARHRTMELVNIVCLRGAPVYY